LTRILVIGDFHIPRRAKAIPVEIDDFIETNSFNWILCTGDLIHENIKQKLEQIAPMKIVIGNMDPAFPHPDRELLEVDGWRIGLIHGHIIYPRGDKEQLLEVAKRLNVHVLISGHTHSDFIHFQGGILLLNPGSAVGAWSFVASGIPSFMVLELSPHQVIVNLYKLVRDELTRIIRKYEKKQFR